MMSWSINGLTGPAPHAKEALASDANVPQSIKDYVFAGIDGLVAYHGDENVPVRINGSGHVCTGVGSYDVTTATIEVKRVSEA